MKVYHVQGKELVEIHEPYQFMNGDVYVIDNTSSPDKTVYVWLGSKAFADDRGVGAWAARKLDLDDSSITIRSEVEGEESAEFKQLLNFSVIEGDTPGFLKHVEINEEKPNYALYRVYDADVTDGSSSDDIVIEEVPLTKKSLKSDDVYVLDGFNDLFVWIGQKAQVGEKAAGQRLARKFDVERKRNPMIYTIHEGEEPKAFFDLMERLERIKSKEKKRSSKTKEYATTAVKQAAKRGLFKRALGWIFKR